MLYYAYQLQADAMNPVRALAQIALTAVAGRRAMAGGALANMAAAYEIVSRARLTHHRPDFGIRETRIGNQTVPVREETVTTTPFGTLLRFAKESPQPQPRILLVAPLSGHFATLLRNTVETLLPEHDVFITDWHNAREIPTSAGRFGFDEYVEHLIAFLDAIGPGGHIFAVCQPCVQTLVAAALMAETQHRAAPRTMTLMAGPIDTRVNPTTVNKLATEKPIHWFERNLITRVPWGFKGANRPVYPGFIQLAAFMSMNYDRHLQAHIDLFEHLASGDMAKAEAIKTFYDEYFAVLDLPAEFYIETVKFIFQEARLANGTLEFRGRRVNPAAIKRTALLTVEGERDDICAVGQTLAAHDLCSGIRPSRRRHHLQPGAGHYGVFSGRKWQQQIYPLVRNFVLAND
jgi:polyhydroxyalkanoate depolymerase